ncbi:MAG: 2-oxoacid:acceptor oxidoreductase subunit alpha, partial [Saprospiraceae bacterium]|nr:2-oxoacid:acceptor oxidoreductase subunit alpha [Saprospiraceae bacterium]
PYTVSHSDKNKDKIFIDGNAATALGLLYGGATVAAWYPITPSTSVAKAFTDFSKKYRVDQETGKMNVAIIQAEDELAAIGMVIGAAWNGARAFTATSGAGVSLMNEFIGLAYFAEIPVALINVQRGGPSTGMPTRTQQADIMSCAYASHGDTKHVLLFPSTPKECFEMAVQCLDLAERLQTPVILMSDLDLGMNEHVSDAFEWDPDYNYDRGKVYSAEDLERIETFGRYLDVDGDGIPYRTYPGTHPTKGSFFTRGTSRDEYARYTEQGDAYVRNVDRLTKKWETSKKLVPKPKTRRHPMAKDFAIIFFGTTYYAALEAMELLTTNRIYANAMCIKAFPFNKDVEDFVNEHQNIFVIEQNKDGQLKQMLVNELGVPPSKFISILNYDGMPITADKIFETINSNIKENHPELLSV